MALTARQRMRAGAAALIGVTVVGAVAFGGGGDVSEVLEVVEASSDSPATETTAPETTTTTAPETTTTTAAPETTTTAAPTTTTEAPPVTEPPTTTTTSEAPAPQPEQPPVTSFPQPSNPGGVVGPNNELIVVPPPRPQG